MTGEDANAEYYWHFRAFTRRRGKHWIMNNGRVAEHILGHSCATQGTLLSEFITDFGFYGVGAPAEEEEGAGGVGH